MQLARWLKPKRIIGFGDVKGLDVSLPLDRADRHEVEDVLASRRSTASTAHPRLGRSFRGAVPSAPTLTVGVDISARKPSQRWPAARFAETMRAIAVQGSVRFMLLWSPGAEDNPLHPGDDAKAREVMAEIGGGALCLPGIPLDNPEEQYPRGRGQVTVMARPTQTLPELIVALAECHALICADGGAMHLAAGLGLPIVCLFGNSGAPLATVGRALSPVAEPIAPSM